MTETAPMTMADAAQKAGAFLNVFRSMKYLAEILDAAARAENVTAEREMQAKRLAVVVTEHEANIAKAKAEALAVRESAEAYAKDIKGDADDELKKSQAVADGLILEAGTTATDQLAAVAELVQKREAELAAITEVVAAKTAEIASLDDRIAKARDAMRKLLG